MAGNLTVEQCGQIFQNTKREASSNYGIGSDGRIALYVHEEDRAWTSGSPTNDHRAITIEVANSKAEYPWPVSDKAMSALLDLVTDICKRNGIDKLVWKSDAYSRVHHLNGANMTVHRDFQATACPGAYLFSKMGWIADEVNARLEDDMTYEKWKEYMKQYKEEEAAKPADSWAEPAIKKVKEAGVMVGDDDGNFRPQSPVRREELAVVVAALPEELQVKISL